jgi:predicted amidohydrolase
MKDRDLRVTLVQPDIIWKETTTNLSGFSELLEKSVGETDLVLLPEMFATGFCTDPLSVAEHMDGITVQWMKKAGRRLNAAVAGSLVIKEFDQYFNRLVYADPQGTLSWYDKRHLFRMAGEEVCFTAGSKRLVVSFRNWRLCFQICYDLRFPVWNRNRNDYDLLIFVANWPAARSDVWNTLLRARALENQCFVAGINRIGTDGNGIAYTGESMVIDPKGNVAGAIQSPKERIASFTLSLDDLEEFRAKFPVWKDWDAFTVTSDE